MQVIHITHTDYGAQHNLPHLLKVPARVRFLSCEPMMGAVDIHFQNTCMDYSHADFGCPGVPRGGIHWIIVGGESGRNARPMHPDWARSLRDQCQAAGVPFFFKQWGEYSPGLVPGNGDDPMYFKVGKKAAGRMLDGSEWNQMPK